MFLGKRKNKEGERITGVQEGEAPERRKENQIYARLFNEYVGDKKERQKKMKQKLIFH